MNKEKEVFLKAEIDKTVFGEFRDGVFIPYDEEGQKKTRESMFNLAKVLYEKQKGGNK